MTAWYLRLDASPAAAVLVGDRGRVLMAAGMLEDATLVNEERGLTTVVGRFNGAGVVVSAFGMGAPIAAVVMHELAALGATTFVRAGTMMTRGLALGTYIVADRALVHEGTSVTYGNAGGSVELDRGMADALAAACDEVPVVRGTVASCDGFYTQMTDLLGEVPAELVTRWDAADVIGLDMETSALASVGAALGVRFGSLCLATVDVNGPVMLEPPAREAGEARLMGAALGVATTQAAAESGTRRGERP